MLAARVCCLVPLVMAAAPGKKRSEEMFRQSAARSRWMQSLIRRNRDLSVKNMTVAETVEEEQRTLRAESYRFPKESPKGRIAFAPGEFRMAARQLYYSAKKKLVVCAIPKTASTELIKLMYRLEGDPKWMKDPHFRGDAPTLATLSLAEATNIMNDPSITKAVFLRDPLTRLLSAYLDKFVLSPKRGMHANYAIKHFGKKKAMNFSDFVNEIAKNDTNRASPAGLHLGTNPHWKPQRFQCSLEKFLPVFSFVGRYEHIREHAEALLRAKGLWESFGKEGWAPAFYRKDKRNQTLRDAIFDRAAAHSTNANNRYRDYYQKGDLRRVATTAYVPDYDMLRVLGTGDAPVSGVRWEHYLRERPNRRILCAFDARAFGNDYCSPAAS